MPQRVFSGVQPTGSLHLGNWLGAIRNWVGLQDDYTCIFCVVDLHALTTSTDRDALRDGTRQVVAAYIAAGIDPKRSLIFAQSAVAGHAQLQWFLSTMTPLGWLNRMTQFKEKAGKKRDQAVLGLYAYPVLMAADILLYQAQCVPVGEDQKQHLELARDIAGAVNHRFGVDVFALPEPLIQGPAPRVMSLRDGTSKMSKSDVSKYSRIHLCDDADTIATKIRKAKTDSLPLPQSAKEWADRPEAANLMTIAAALANINQSQALARWGGRMFSDLKNDMVDLSIATICPIGDEIKRLLKDRDVLDDWLAQGNIRANDLARHTLAKVSKHLGVFMSL